MKKREATSKRVASIAGKILKRLDGKYPDYSDGRILVVSGIFEGQVCTVSELKALCASALTQREGKK